MKLSKAELKKQIDKDIKSTSKQSREDYDVVLNKAFMSSTISKQELPVGTFDKEDEKNNLQPVTMSEKFKSNFGQNMALTNRLFFKATYTKMLKLILFTIFTTFLFIGIWYAFQKEEGVEPINIQFMVSMWVIFIPISFWSLYIVPNYILSIRETNLIGRIKMKGVSKIQYIFFIALLSWVMIFAMVLLSLFFIMTATVGLANKFAQAVADPNLGVQYFHIMDMMLGLWIVNLAFVALGATFIGIIIGFKVTSYKTTSTILVVEVVLLMFAMYGMTSVVSWSSTDIIGQFGEIGGKVSIALFGYSHFLNPLWIMFNGLFITMSDMTMNGFPGSLNGNADLVPEMILVGKASFIIQYSSSIVVSLMFIVGSLVFHDKIIQFNTKR